MTKEEYESKLSLYRTFSKEARKLRWGIFKYRVVYFFKYEKWKAVKLFCMLVVIGFLLQVLVLNRIETQIIKMPGSVKIVYVEDTGKNMRAFLSAIKWEESRNNQKIVNEYGYMGFYQIGRQALKDIGMEGISKEDFLESAELQEIVMEMLLKKNKEYLKSYIGKYQGKIISGVFITESGMLAAAHGTGAGSVMKFLSSNGAEDPADGNGVKTSTLLRRYAGYTLRF